MVVVQKMTKKQPTVATVKALSVWFHNRLTNLTRVFDEIILVFDLYKADSLKTTTRANRRIGKDPVQYQVQDQTNTRHLTMSRFLSHDQTKVDLIEYQAKKTLDYSSDSTQIVITSAGSHTRSNKDVGIASREQS